MYINRVLQMAILFFCLLFIWQQAEADCVSPQIVSSLQSSFSDWQVVRLEDLRPDDREMWTKQHGTSCPGYTEGYYEIATRKTFAITLFRKSPKLQQMLLVVNQDAKKYKITVLSKPQGVAYLSVISSVPPGEYVDADGEKLSLQRDSVLYEAIQSGSLLFYFREGKYLSVLNSD